MNSIYRDRVRAEGFGDLAAAYDHTRPSYPPELVNRLSRRGVGAAVDVGCGTGQVASLFTGAGWSVIGVEPDRRMAEIARAHGVDVVVSRFEHWAANRRDYDLVCSGTAWHWIDPTVGYDIAAGLLRPGGQLAIFRNSYIYDRDIADAIGASLRRRAPHLAQDCIPLGTSSDDLVGAHASEITKRPDLFVDVDRQLFTHERNIAASEWVEELRTHSPVAMLDEAVREPLLGELAGLVTSSGGARVRIRHATPCVVATRR